MQVFHGPGPGWAYGYPVSDGQLFTIGNLNIKAPLTPGHTEDSVCYAVADSRSGDTVLMVFTSDTLFTGSTGRTDLEGPAEAYGMASKLYYSIYNKLEPLGDAAIIHPAHEAGSVCGPHIADRPESTLGIEKAFNPSLANKTGQEFVKMKESEHLELPPYFEKSNTLTSLEWLPWASRSCQFRSSRLNSSRRWKTARL